MDCKNASRVEWLMDISALIRILILRQESRRDQSVKYTQIMAIADIYNVVGLFFGISFLSIYGALESAVIASKEDKTSQNSPDAKGSGQNTTITIN